MSFIINPYVFGGGGAPSVASIIFASNADHEATAQDSWKGGGNPALTSGVTGAHGLVFNNLTNNQTTGALPANYVTASVGCRFQVRTDVSSDVIIRFLDSGASVQMGLRYITGGAFRVHRGNATTLQTSSTGLIALNTWYYCELRVTIDNSAGAYEANLYDDSGSLLVSLSDPVEDTQETANANVNFVLAGGTAADTYIDDVWVDSGGALHGPSQVETLYPNGAGDLAQLTRGGADSGANWSQCEEATQNGDTDYVVSTSTNQFDCYAFQDRSVTGTPLGVVVVATAKLASGTPTIKLFVRIAGVTYEGTITHTLTSAYKCYFEGWSNNPATGNAWTDSEINSAQFGVKCVDANARVSQVVADVVVQL